MLAVINTENQEYEDGLIAGAELAGFGIGTIQSAIEGMNWSASYIDGIWAGRQEAEQKKESAFYENLISETNEYQTEKRMYELNALQNQSENELVQDR